MAEATHPWRPTARAGLDRHAVRRALVPVHPFKQETSP